MSDDDLRDRDETIEQLGDALLNARVIGRAQGILMERYKVTADEAFAMLRDRSNERQEKVRDVALRLTQTGEL